MVRCLTILVLMTAVADAAPAPASIELSVIADAWPARPRVVGYEYNQKNHHDPPTFIRPPDSGGMHLQPPSSGRRFRVIGVRLSNPGTEPLQAKIRSRQIRRGNEIKVEVPPGRRVVRYFAIVEPKDLRVDVEILARKGGSLARKSFELPAHGHITLFPSEALAVERELQHEEIERRHLTSRPIHITVRDDLGLPVPSTHLLILQQGGLLVYEGDTDDAGEWTGHVLPGGYDIYALGEVPDRTDRTAPTAVQQLPRLLAIEAQVAARSGEIVLTPDRVIDLRLRDANGDALVAQRLWITPTALAGAYRYAEVAQSLGARARVDSKRPLAGGTGLVLTSATTALDIAALAEPTDDLSIFLRGQVQPGQGPTDLELDFDPARLGRMVLDPTTGPGPGLGAHTELERIDGAREKIVIDTVGLHTLYADPGSYRCAVDYRYTRSDVKVAPWIVTCGPGTFTDLTPRRPFSMTLAYLSKPTEKKQQFWLSIRDAAGHILESSPNGKGVLTAMRGGRKVFEEQLRSLRWEMAQKSATDDPERLNYYALLPIGDEDIEGTPVAKPTIVFNAEGASARAPASLADHVQALLPEVKRSIDGCWRFLGLPEGLRRINMQFDIFLPPGVGGLGGGGTITLDAMALLPFACGTDLLPGAYRHELGHNLGFGHDPYMLLAPSGVDEERFGLFGYRMLHARDFEKTLDYLQRERCNDTDPWSPGRGVYAALRMLYGPDVHRRMIEERRASEQTLRLHNLSSIERIATLYSLVVNENVAWVFRAHGWPVFDDRVDLGGSAVRFLHHHPRQLDYQKVHGAPITAWWVYGPEDAEDGKTWRPIQWPGRFIFLDGERPPASKSRRYLLFRRIVVAKDTEAQLLCASDAQLELRVNGAALGVIDASPQFAQPVHDELMLDQKRPYPVHLRRGENFLEVAAVQPSGSKGFLLELITPEGKPLPVGLLNDGPPGEEAETKVKRLDPRPLVYDGSFEQAKSPAWVQGPTEPAGSLAIGRDDASAAPDGKDCLRMQLKSASRGGLIQRVVVEPGRRYRLSAWIRTQGFSGQAYACLFTGDMHDNQFLKTPPLSVPSAAWTHVEASWFPGTRRVVYVACYVKATQGTVWFDGITLTEIK